MTKLEAFTKYMSQFAAHRGADMKWVMEASSHGRIFSYAWDEATKAERERIIAKNAPEIERVNAYIKALEDELKEAIIARGEK